MTDTAVMDIRLDPAPVAGPIENAPDVEQTPDVHNDWEISPRNARNWSNARKIATTLLVSAIGFVGSVFFRISMISNSYRVSEDMI